MELKKHNGRYVEIGSRRLATRNKIGMASCGAAILSDTASRARIAPHGPRRGASLEGGTTSMPAVGASAASGPPEGCGRRRRYCGHRLEPFVGIESRCPNLPKTFNAETTQKLLCRQQINTMKTHTPKGNHIFAGRFFYFRYSMDGRRKFGWCALRCEQQQSLWRGDLGGGGGGVLAAPEDRPWQTMIPMTGG